MMKREEKDKNPKKENTYNVYYENYLDTNACTECTGLIPRESPHREDWEKYLDIFDFLPKPPRPDEHHE